MTPCPKRPKPVRDKDHLAFVRTLPCLICGAYGVDAHHVRAFQPRTMGKRVGDDKVVPLCRVHHDEAHAGREEEFWGPGTLTVPILVATAPHDIARQLYKHTGDADTCERVIREWREAA